MGNIPAERLNRATQRVPTEGGILMLKLKMKQLLALFVCGLLVRPAPIMASPDATTPSRAVLGSVTARGVVHVGEVQVPGMSALFSGDQVQTLAGNALVQYEQGARVVLGNESLASFSSSRVELQKGRMSFSTEAGKPLFAASTLRIEPASAKSAANVTLSDHKATVAVTEGTFKVLDPSGVQLASLRAGEARLFEEASAAVPSPPAAAAAAPPPPQGGGGSTLSRAWLVALGVGIVGTSLGIAGIVRANDADDRADQAATDANQARAQAQAAQAQIAAAQATTAALTTQVNALRAQLTALQAQAAAGNVQVANLAAALANLNSLESQLNGVQNQFTQLLADIARQGGVATAAQIAQLQSLGGTLNSLFAAVQTATAVVGQIVDAVIRVFSGTRIP